jgi:hypothetical protein
MTITIRDEHFVAGLGLMFAAFCIWLTVRIINRRERWAKWTLAAVVGLPVLYVASFGPACWWFSAISELPHAKLPAFRRVPQVYRPIGWVARRRPTLLRGLIGWYATYGLRDEFMECETEFGDQYNAIWFTK